MCNKKHCMNEHNEIEERLLLHDIKPTATRMLVFKALLEAEDAMSLSDLEDTLGTVDKSTIFRSLTAFSQHHLVHEIDDGSGSVKYEPCCHDHNHDGVGDNDQHTHFFCTECQHTYCLKGISAPVVDLPDGFEVERINYVLKGICPSCQSKKR